MKVTFSPALNIRRFLFIVTSMAVLILTLILEKCVQQFVDSTTFSLEALCGLIALCLMLAVFRYGKNYLKTYLEKNGSFEVQAQAVQNILSRDCVSFETIETGSVLYNVTEDMYTVMPWCVLGKIQCVLEIVSLICLCAFMLWMDVWLTLAALLLIALSLWCARILSDRLGRDRNVQQSVHADLNQYMISAVTGINTIKQLDKASFFAKQYDAYLETRYVPVIKKLITSHALFIFQIILSQEIIPFLMLCMGVVLTILGKSTIGSALVIMDLTLKTSGHIQSIGDSLSQRSLFREVKARIAHLFIPPSTDAFSPSSLDAFKHMSISIKDYHHKRGAKTVLEHIAFELHKGDVCLITGESGAGKSTLAKLIVGLQKIDRAHGEILYNGLAVQDLSSRAYHRRVLLVNQDTVLFPGTVRDNIAMEKDIAPQDLEVVIRACGLQDFIDQQGLDFYIEHTGDNISGGEKQRIGLARMLIREPDILVLDEVTSALDHKTAQAVTRGVVEFAKNRSMTLVVISHTTDFEPFCNKVVHVKQPPTHAYDVQAAK